MAAVTMGFGDPLSPLQSVNRLLNLFSVRIPNGKGLLPFFYWLLWQQSLPFFLKKNAYFVRKHGSLLLALSVILCEWNHCQLKHLLF